VLAGELEDQPGVNRAEGGFGRNAALADQPFDLRAGEVRIEHEPGALAEERLVAGLLELVAAARRAAVLPDERAVERLAGLRSHATTVSRWFVIPMPASERPSIPAESSASFATARVTSQISLASCSTQPGRGKCWRNSRYARPTGRPRSSNAMQVVLVVP
jgi:hypothetical protein